MKVIEVKGRKYIDQELFDHIEKIWLNFDSKVPDESNLMFAKNTTIDRRITDYNGTGIRRVIKKEKADYLVVNRFSLNNYPQFYNNVSITDNPNDEVVYGIYNMSIEIQDTIELILDFILRGQNIKYINQDKLNESVNNGFVIDKDNYISLKELIDSGNQDNHNIAVNMISNSNLKANLDWLVYLYFGQSNKLFNYDKKGVVTNYIKSVSNFYYSGSRNNNDPFYNIDKALDVVKDQDVKCRLIAIVNDKFNKNITEYLKEKCGTEKFKLNDFKIEYV